MPSTSDPYESGRGRPGRRLATLVTPASTSEPASSVSLPTPTPVVSAAPRVQAQALPANAVTTSEIPIPAPELSFVAPSLAAPSLAAPSLASSSSVGPPMPVGADALADVPQRDHATPSFDAPDPRRESARRPGVLPAPGALPAPGRYRGERSPGSDSRPERRRNADSPVTSAAPLPRGVRPPSSTDASSNPLNTQLLIAGIAEALTADEPEEIAAPSSSRRDRTLAAALASAAPPPPASNLTLPMPASDIRGTSPHSAVPWSLASEPPRRWVWLGAVAAALLVVGGAWALLSGGDEDGLAEARAAVTHHELAQHESMRSDDIATAAAARPSVPASPTSAADSPIPAPEDAVPLAADAAPSDDDAADLGENDAASPSEGSTPVDAAADASAAPADARSSSNARSSSRTDRRHRTATRSAPATPSAGAAPIPAPSAPAAEPSASELLTSARAAFKTGDASNAYRLAMRSNSKSKSRSALQLMARAACKMKQRDKAKSAFDRLPVADRNGIRSECRNYGVRLGL